MKILCLSIAFGWFWFPLTAQLQLIHLHQPVGITFDQTTDQVSYGAFNGAGFDPIPAPGQLDSDAWEISGFSDGDLPFGGSNNTGDYARGVSPGGVTTGGIYSFETAAGDYSLGIQPTTADFTPGSITLKIKNLTAQTLQAIDISYTLHYLDDGGYSSGVSLFWSTDGYQYHLIPSLTFYTPVGPATAPAWQSALLTAFQNNLVVPPDQVFYLRWTGQDNGGSGSRDEWSLDNVFVMPYAIPANPGDLIFTEIMYDPSGPEPTSEWFEIFNTSPYSYPLAGWTFADAGGSFTVDPGSSLQIDPGSYLVFSRSTPACSPADYQYGNVILNNTGDIIQMYQGSILVDAVDYQSGFPATIQGESIQLDDESQQNDITNDLGGNWCVSRTVCGSGDKGTPGQANDNCCYFSEVAVNLFCLDNQTSNNPGDDQYYVTLHPLGAGFGGFYQVSGDISNPSQSYGAESDLFGIFSITQTLNVSLQDGQDNTCTYTLNISPPPHCSYHDGDFFVESQFVNPCGGDGSNEFALFFNQTAVSLHDLAVGSARNTSDLTYVWLGTNYNNAPTNIPSYTGIENCDPGALFCYHWLYPSNASDQITITNYLQTLNTLAGCPVFMPVPPSDSIPAGSHTAAFLAGGSCLPDAPAQNLNFSNHCSGAMPIQQYYTLLGTGNPCGPAGYFENNGPRVAFISNGLNLSTRSYFLNNSVEPGIVTPAGTLEGPPTPCIPFSGELLPIAWHLFEATLQDEAVVLTWQGNPSDQAGTFSIQRSQDGLQFSTLGFVKAGTKHPNDFWYTFTDPLPQPGNNYYRLHFLGSEGATSLSPLRVIRFSPDENWHFHYDSSLESGIFFRSIPCAWQESATFYSLTGSRILRMPLSAGITRSEIQLSHLPSGIYFVQLEHKTTRFFKEK